jgi:integrase
MSTMQRTRVPGVFQRGTKFVAVYRDPEGKQRKRAFATQTEAAKFKRSQEVAVEQGTFAPDTTMTLHAYYAEWIQTKTRNNTREGYAYSWKHIGKHFGPRVKLSAMSRRGIKSFYAQLVTDGVGYGAIEKAARVLSSMLTAAVDDELIRANPALGVKVPKPPVKPSADDHEDCDVRVFTDEQLTVILATVGGRHRVLLELLANTGLRISEALALEWRHLQLDGSRPHVKVRRQLERGGAVEFPKTNAGRRDVALPRALVLKLREAAGQADALVFASDAGTPLDYHNLLKRVLKPAMQEAGVSEGGFHLFRHTYASAQLRAGTAVIPLSKAMGHSKPSVTLDIYGHLMAGDEAPALDVAAIAAGGVDSAELVAA